LEGGWNSAYLASGGVRAEVSRNHYVTALRLLGAGELQILGNSQPIEQIWGIGLLVGVHQPFANKWFLVSAKAGIGGVIDVRRGRLLEPGGRCGNWLCLGSSPPPRYERILVPAPSAVAEAKLIITPFRHFGFGWRVVGNLNAVRPFYGVLYTFQVIRL
jgi:hypothetical protein